MTFCLGAEVAQRITDQPVLVTGATGFIGAELVKQLLARGYRIRGTTRDPVRAREEGFLTGLPGAADRLELVGADLLEPASIARAIAGCEYVCHLASPYTMDAADPQKDLVDPAVRGTEAVINGAASAAGVSRIVLTSSMAAITDRADGTLLTEEVWNETSSLTESPYYFSKARAERAAWDAMGDGDKPFDLVVINPGLVLGPSIVPGLNTSQETLVGLTDGTFPVVIGLPFVVVDVRDVARAHISAMESPDAGGRYITAAGTRTLRQIAEVLRANGWADRYRIPKLSMDNAVGNALARIIARTRPPGVRSFLGNHLGGEFRIDNSKIRDGLGMSFRDIDQTILDAMADLERWGHLGRTR